MSKKKEPGFEESMKELEKIVDGLEKGQTSLEDSLSQYERGIKLSQHCQHLLDSAEQKIEILNKDNQFAKFNEDGN